MKKLTTEQSLARLSAALTKLGIAFCPECGEPHNIYSQRTPDLDGNITFFTNKGEELHVCAGCAAAWLKKSRRKIAPKKYGFSIASWILEQSVHDADHPHHEVAIELCAAYDIRFDLLMLRRAKVSALEQRCWSEAQLLESLGYRYDLEARKINKAVLDYIDHVRAGGKPETADWPPVKKAA